MRWITREHIKVDAVFLFVPERELLAAATREGATPFDATRLTEVKLNHRGDRCTFEAILEDFHLSDPALLRLGQIVRAADVKGQESVAPEGLGLRVIAQGFAALGLPDDERLRLQFPIYDALYAHMQQQTV